MFRLNILNLLFTFLFLKTGLISRFFYAQNKQRENNLGYILIQVFAKYLLWFGVIFVVR